MGDVFALFHTKNAAPVAVRKQVIFLKSNNVNDNNSNKNNTNRVYIAP
jgi:hypothetical protein